MRSPKVGSAFFALTLALGFASADVHSEPAEKPEDLPESIRYSYPPVPPELWKEFVDSVHADGRIEVAQALKEEQMQPLIEQWSNEIEAPLTASYVPFLEIVGLRQNVGYLQWERPTAAGSPRRPMPASPMPRPSPAGEVESPSLWAYRPNSVNRSYFVPASQVQTLMFPVLHGVASKHPLNEKLDRFEIENENLLAIIDKILEPTGISYDHAFNHSAGKVMLGLRLSNCSRFECLRTAVEAANFELSTQRFGQDPRINDPNVRFESVVHAYRAQQTSRAASDAQAAQETEAKTPVEILHDSIQQAVQQIREGRDITIGIRPRSPLTQVNVKVDESNRQR